MLVVGLLEVVWEKAERLCGSALAEGDAVLVVLLGKGIGKIRGMPTSRFRETNDLVSGKVSHETIKQRYGDTGLLGKGLGSKSILGFLKMLKDLCVICNFETATERSLLEVSRW